MPHGPGDVRRFSVSDGEVERSGLQREENGLVEVRGIGGRGFESARVGRSLGQDGDGAGALENTFDIDFMNFVYSSRCFI